MISLGCAKNLVDAEIMIGGLVKDGLEVTNDAASADVLIVNTCSFIDAAQQESVDTILESAQLREAQHRGQALVVSGCLPQRFREELPKLLPEVDAFMGIDQVAQVSDIIRQAFARRALRLKGPAPSTRRGRVTLPNAPLKVGSGSHADPEHPDSAGDFDAGVTKSKGNSRGAGLQSVDPIVNVTARPHYIPDYATPRFRLTPRHFAYLKIAEGCNHPCSFCIIPRMRGSHRSRTQQDIVQEARQLLAEGVKEINLISQDSTYYGLDLRPVRAGSIAAPEQFKAATRQLAADTPTLCTLLRELDALPGDFWIRLLYTHPAHWTDELIQTLAECRHVARYVDMPLQHIDANMLERMRRETTREYITDLIAKIRAGIPGIALRTTFIVGFPGESEAAFETLLDFIRQTRFERLGVFTYSHEEGTRASKMQDQVSDKEKIRRRDRAMAEQLQVARSISAAAVGRELRVLVENEAHVKELRQANLSSWEHGLVRDHALGAPELKGRLMVARSEADGPDIDGRVYFRGHLPVGSFAQVRIVGHTDYDLVAEPL
jgi:ribosomal protein S12 methylthiotransferase